MWVVPAPPRHLLARLQFLEDHIIQLEKEYPPWAALHFNQPNRGVRGTKTACHPTDDVMAVASASSTDAHHRSFSPHYTRCPAGNQRISDCEYIDRRSIRGSRQGKGEEQVEFASRCDGKAGGAAGNERLGRDEERGIGTGCH